MDVSYTWSKALDFTASDDVDNQGFNESGTVSATPDLLNLYNNKKYSFSDIPSRFVANGVYETPLLTGNRLARSVLGHWSTGVVFISQDGSPIAISSPSTGSVRGLGNRIPGVPVEVPEADQHWYDGKTSVTLNCGRVIARAVRTYLKYNADVSLRREFSIKERTKLQFVANAANILNHSERNSADSGSLGSTVTAANGATVGQGTSAPRQITLSVRIRF